MLNDCGLVKEDTVPYTKASNTLLISYLKLEFAELAANMDSLLASLSLSLSLSLSQKKKKD